MEEEKNPYGEGHEAYHDGYRLSDNPYKRQTDDWREWKQGWEDEKSDDPYWESIRNYHRNN